MSCCSVASFVRLLRLANCLSIMAASSKFVTDAIKCCILVCGMEKSIKYSQDQSSIMLLFEHIFSSFAVVLGVKLKSIMLKFSSIMYVIRPGSDAELFMSRT